jgi:hypothetical protein
MEKNIEIRNFFAIYFLIRHLSDFFIDKEEIQKEKYLLKRKIVIEIKNFSKFFQDTINFIFSFPSHISLAFIILKYQKITKKFNFFYKFQARLNVKNNFNSQLFLFFQNERNFIRFFLKYLSIFFLSIIQKWMIGNLKKKNLDEIFVSLPSLDKNFSQKIKINKSVFPFFINMLNIKKFFFIGLFIKNNIKNKIIINLIFLKKIFLNSLEDFLDFFGVVTINIYLTFFLDIPLFQEIKINLINFFQKRKNSLKQKFLTYIKKKKHFKGKKKNLERENFNFFSKNFFYPHIKFFRKILGIYKKLSLIFWEITKFEHIFLKKTFNKSKTVLPQKKYEKLIFWKKKQYLIIIIAIKKYMCFENYQFQEFYKKTFFNFEINISKKISNFRRYIRLIKGLFFFDIKKKNILTGFTKLFPSLFFFLLILKNEKKVQNYSDFFKIKILNIKKKKILLKFLFLHNSFEKYFLNFIIQISGDQKSIIFSTFFNLDLWIIKKNHF